jgi:hypothetical protein
MTAKTIGISPNRDKFIGDFTKNISIPSLPRMRISSEECSWKRVEQKKHN